MANNCRTAQFILYYYSNSIHYFIQVQVESSVASCKQLYDKQTKKKPSKKRKKKAQQILGGAKLFLGGGDAPSRPPPLATGLTCITTAHLIVFIFHH